MSQTPTFFSKKTNEFSKRFPKFKRCNLFKTSREAKNFFCFLTTTKGHDLFTWPIWPFQFKMRSLTSNVNLPKWEVWHQMSTSQNEKFDFKCQTPKMRSLTLNVNSPKWRTKFYPIQNKNIIGKDWTDLNRSFFSLRHDYKNKCFAYKFRPTPWKLIVTSFSQEITAKIS